MAGRARALDNEAIATAVAGAPVLDGVSYRPISELRLWGRNYREGDVGAIITSIRRFGFNGALRVWQNGTVIAGNHTLQALGAMERDGIIPRGDGVRAGPHGWEVRTIDVTHLSEDEARAFAIADNRTTELAANNEEVLAGLLSELASQPDLLAATGYDSDDLDAMVGRMMKEAEELELEERDGFGDVSEELDGPLQLKPGFSYELGATKYDFPPLRGDRLLPLPEGLETWPGDDLAGSAGPGPYLFIWTGTSRRLALDRSVICFYTDDSRFEGIWKNPDRFATRCLNAGVLGAVAPNFSLWRSDPLSVHIYQVYRSRWLARYWQEAGLRVIPDVDWGRPDDLEFVFDGLPKGLPCISKQLQAFNPADPVEFNNEAEGIKRMMEVVEPQSVLFYGSKRGRELVESLGLGVPYVLLPTLMDLRRGHLRTKKAPFWGRERD